MLLLFISILMVLAQDHVYSGVAHVEGLGEIAFPPGNWILEDRIKPSDKPGAIDAYVFRRKGHRLERLSFKRFDPDEALSIGCYFDSIGESMSNGIPITPGQNNAHDSVDILIPVNDWQTIKEEVVCKGSSFLYESEKSDPWIGHAFVCSVDGWVLVACHASPHVLSFENFQKIYFDSKFQPKLIKRQ